MGKGRKFDVTIQIVGRGKEGMKNGQNIRFSKDAVEVDDRKEGLKRVRLKKRLQEKGARIAR